MIRCPVFYTTDTSILLVRAWFRCKLSLIGRLKCLRMQWYSFIWLLTKYMFLRYFVCSLTQLCSTTGYGNDGGSGKVKKTLYISSVVKQG